MIKGFLESNTVWYRGSNSIDPLAMSDAGNSTEQYGPGIYFSNLEKIARGYGTVSRYTIDTSKGFVTEKTRMSPVVQRAAVRLLILAAPNYAYTLENFDENPRVALRTAIEGFLDFNDNYAEVLQAVAGDFYRDHGKQFVAAAVAQGINGLIMTDEEFQNLILYNTDLAEVVGD